MTTKALFVGLVFYTHSYTIQTLQSLNQTFDIILLECNSQQSENVKKAIDAFAENWSAGFRHVLYSENLIGLVYRRFMQENQSLISQYDVIITCDMDVEFSKETNWPACFETIQKQPNIGVLSFPCSTINHTAACNGYDSIFLKNVSLSSISNLNIGSPNNQNNTGWQCIMMSTATAIEFFVHSTHIAVLDSELGKWIKSKGENWYVAADFPVRHLMWDAYVFPQLQPADVQDYIDWKKNSFSGWIKNQNDCVTIFDRQLKPF